MRLGVVNLEQYYATVQRYRFNTYYIPFRLKSRVKVLKGGYYATKCRVRARY